MGQGALRARHINIPASSNNTPDIKNIYSLYLLRATNHGAVLTSPANAAPAPMLTINAGRAQQSNVPAEVNRLSKGIAAFFKL